MLSYQHEYHAGNHGDLLKHICLVQILQSLCKKEKPFTVIDTHSSAGVFSLNDERLLKTGEAEGGIKKLMSLSENSGHEFLNRIPLAVSEYLDVQKPYYDSGLYAGSAEIERIFLRQKDQLNLVERHPQTFASLKENVSKDVLLTQAKRSCAGKVHIYNEDCWKQLTALTPPLIKRGLILIDPSYEDRSDYEATRNAIMTAHKKWNTAIIALWYPLIARRKNETAQMLSGLEDFVKMQLTPAETFRMELKLFDERNLPAEMLKEDGSHLYGSGMFVINPPWQLKENLEQAVKFLESEL